MAADRVEIAYHRQAAQDDDEVRRGAAKSGTTPFHRYATRAVVHSGQRFTLTFVWAGETMDVVLARLLMHPVRARTSSRNPALRLLMVGLALLIVNLWVLLLRTWVQVTRYGGRVRIVELTLERIADALVDSLKQLLGVIPVSQVKVVLHAT